MDRGGGFETNRHEPGLQRGALTFISLGTILFFLWLSPPLYPVELANYLPTHIFMETFAIVVAILVFSIGWFTYSKDHPANLTILACAYLAVGLMDFAHLLSYNEMPDFVTPGSPQKAIYFWLVSRLIEDLTLFSVAMLPWKPFKSSFTRYGLLALSLIITVLVYWVGLFHEELVSNNFVPGKGLTDFKIAMEYLVITIHLITAFLLYFKMRKSQAFDINNLITAVLILGLGEFCFTLYTAVNDIFNLLGHIYIIIAYIFIIKAVFVSGVRYPYERLQQTEDQLRKSKKGLAKAQQIAHLGSWDLDLCTNVLTWSDEIYRIFGCRPQEFKANYEAFLAFVHPEDLEYVKTSIKEAVLEGKSYNIEHRIVLADGTVRIVHEQAETTFDSSGIAIRMIGIIQDVTERKMAEERLQYLAHYDYLTGLPNRLIFSERLKQAIIQAPRRGQMVAVMFLDLDRFKMINDTLGHDVGDLLLKSVSERLGNCMRESDTVARWGGDEFTLILEGIVHEQDTARVAQKILNTINFPFFIEGHELFLNASIGISLYPVDGVTTEKLIRNADIAMYRAKEMGRHSYQFYTQAMSVSALERLAMENSLRRAMEREEFLIYYQPQVNINTGQIAGVEALIRWRHPEFGMVSPSTFIPVAEETGLILSLGEWVLRTACFQNKAWREAGLPKIRVSVNLSSRQLQQKNLVETVANVLIETGMEPEYLELELTESVLLDNTQNTLDILNQLRAMGVRIAIDDFGTGYSALSYLKHFPVDVLKINKIFIGELHPKREDVAITTAIVSMAHSLNLKVIAEEVETLEQLKLLRSLKCDEIQGYLFSGPLPAEELSIFAANQVALH